jgi:hypothetical protein
VTESRQEFLARVAEEHDNWVARHLDNAPFDPNTRPGSGDYNVWHVDVEADAAQEDELAEAIGPTPELTDDLPEYDGEDEEEVTDDGNGEGGR